MQRWVNEIANDGLIRYTHLFNAERLLITSPKGLGEVLVQKSYEFVKPARVRNGLGRLLGIGVLLAEGEEHKVEFLTNLAEPKMREVLILGFRCNESISCRLFPTAMSRICTPSSGQRLVSLFKQSTPRFKRPPQSPKMTNQAPLQSSN